LIAAHRLAPASLLSPFIYSQLVWVIALGYGVFGDVPDAYTLAGALLVIASGAVCLSPREGPRTAHHKGAADVKISLALSYRLASSSGLVPAIPSFRGQSGNNRGGRDKRGDDQICD